MAKLKLEQALNNAKANPNSQFATKLRTMIENGELDEAANKQGVDLSPFGRPSPQEMSTFGERISDTVRESGEEVAETFQEGVSEQEEGKQSAISTGLQTAGSVARGFFRTVGEAGKSAIAPFVGGRENVEQAEEFVGEQVERGVDALAETEPFRKIGEGIADLEKVNPELARKYENTLESLTSAGEVAAAPLAGVEWAAVSRFVSQGVRSKAKSMYDSLPTLDDVNTNNLPSSTLTQEAAASKFAKTIDNSIIGDKKAVNGKLNSIAERSSRSKESILSEFSEEIIQSQSKVDVKGSRIDLTNFKNHLNQSQDNINGAIRQRMAQLNQQQNLTDIETLRSYAHKALRESRGSATEFDKIQKQIDKMIESTRSRYGRDTLTPEEINDLRIEMNARYKPQTAERAEIDSSLALGRATRQRIGELSPKTSDALKESGRLFEIDKVARVIDQEKIDINQIVNSMAGFAGTVGVGVAGIATLAGRGGSILVAALGSKVASQIIAKFIRKHKTSVPSRVRGVVDDLRQNQVIDDLIEEASDKDAQTIRGYLEEPAIRQRESGDTQVSPQRRSEFEQQIEGQVSRNQIQTELQEQARKFRSRESFLNLARNNQMWQQKFERAGTTPENIADIVFNE